MKQITVSESVFKQNAEKAKKAEGLAKAYFNLYHRDKILRVRANGLCIVLLAVIVFQFICLWFVS